MTHTTQKGQILVLALLMLMVLCGLMLSFFYVGQINYQAVRQRHALDAATYSAATLQAQTLNYAAYMNRAYAGHQVAMAHLVTLASWAHFAATQAQRLQRANPPVSLITMMFGPKHGMAYQSAVLAAPAVTPGLIDTQLKNLFQQHQAYSPLIFEPHSHTIYQDLPQHREQRLRAVLHDNYPELNLEQNSHLMQLEVTDDTWHQLLEWRAASSWQPWLHELINHYDFLKPRHQTAKNAWVVQARCPHKRHELRRRGQTQLNSSGHWQAEDTLSFHALRANRWIGCYFREYAMGWAWAQSHEPEQKEPPFETAPEDFSAQDFWRWVQEHTQWDIHEGSANGVAQAWARRDQISWPGQGLRPYLSLRDQPEQFRFKTRLALQMQADAQVIHSQSEAKNTYVLPQARRDQRQEKPNLFQPYWQAALANSEWEQRLRLLKGEF